MRKLWFIMPLFAVLALGAVAQTSPSAIAVQNAWARATSPAAKTGAVYLTIVDHGAPDRVIGFATPVAEMAQLHETTMQGDVMRMRPVDGLAVTDKAPVTLAPGGYHVMLMGLKGPLRPGQTFPLSVTFQNAGTVQITVAVERIGAGGPAKSGAGSHDGSMNHGDMNHGEMSPGDMSHGDMSHGDMSQGDMGKPMAPQPK